MPLVDPFIPAKPSARAHKPRLSQASAKPLRPTNWGYQAAQPPARQAPARKTPSPTATKRYASVQKVTPSKRRRLRWLHWRPITQGILVVCMLLVLIRSTGALSLVEMAIGIYGLLALLVGMPSRVHFLLALLLLVSVPVLLLTTPLSGLSEKCAVYAFLFLIVGTVSLVLETRGSPVYSRRRYSRS